MRYPPGMRSWRLLATCSSVLALGGCESEADRLKEHANKGRSADVEARKVAADASSRANTAVASAAASPAVAASTDATPALEKWPPQGDGCVSFVSCCNEISKVLPSISVCQILYSKHQNCNAAKREFTQRWQRTGGALPPDCK